MQSIKQKNLSQLAQRIRKARIVSRLSQAGLAQGIGVSDKSISSYEQGRSTPPFEKLKKIAQQTQHPISYFTDEDVADASVKQKLAAIERELAEVKKLLRQVKK